MQKDRELIGIGQKRKAVNRFMTEKVLLTWVNIDLLEDDVVELIFSLMIEQDQQEREKIRKILSQKWWALVNEFKHAKSAMLTYMKKLNEIVSDYQEKEEIEVLEKAMKE